MFEVFLKRVRLGCLVVFCPRDPIEPSKKVVWGAFRRFSAFSEDSWTPKK